jgi:hypothetical protein
MATFKTELVDGHRFPSYECPEASGDRRGMRLWRRRSSGALGDSVANRVAAGRKAGAMRAALRR